MDPATTDRVTTDPATTDPAPTDPATTLPADENAPVSDASDVSAGAAEPGLLVEDLIARLLGRAPRPRELEAWTERLGRIRNAENFLRVLLAWKPLREVKAVRSHVPPGHLSSPVVDPDVAGPYVAESRAAATAAVAGVPLDLAAMDAFWARNRAVLAATPFPETPAEGLRYAFLGGAYNFGDGATLRAMLHEHRPRRVVEVGAGAATPCLLDVADEFGLDLAVTCIEPHAGRLGAALREGDEARLAIVAETVQGQPLAPFAALERGDMLLVDSTHVLKTASDVHYLIFHVLPVLAPGVLVQFHDCRFPFEYSDAQIFEKNHSWNEVYAVRALLMYSTRFRIVFSGSFFAAEREGVVRETFPPFLRNPGSALWLEVQDDGAPKGLAAVGGLEGFAARIAPAEGQAKAVAPHRPAAEGQPKAARALHRPAPRPAAKGPPVVLSAGRSRPGGPQMLRADVAAGETTIAFDVVDGASGPAYFGLGVRKSGSTMFHKILVSLARANGINDVNVPGTFFRHGLSVAAWARQDLSAMVRPGNIFTGFRSFPHRLATTEPYVRALKVFMHRDPRDAIVSQYFSDAFSHMLPDQASTGEREKFMEKRHAAQASDIDAWVLENAPSLGRTLEAFAPVLRDPSCLVLSYEAYVFEKRALIDRVLAHFGWAADEDEIASLLAEIDVRPQSEDPKRFVRKATPGDHRDKLKEETVAALDRVFAGALQTFGYA